jgi:hypothetical protein
MFKVLLSWLNVCAEVAQDVPPVARDMCPLLGFLKWYFLVFLCSILLVAHGECCSCSWLVPIMPLVFLWMFLACDKDSFGVPVDGHSIHLVACLAWIGRS